MKFFEKRKKKQRKPLELPLKLLFLVRWVVEVIFHYGLILAMCTYAIPMAVITMGKYIGLPANAEWLDIIMFMLIPACFLVAVLVYVYIKFLQVMHKVFTKIYDKACARYRSIDKDIDDDDDAELEETKPRHKKRRKKS